MRAATSRSLECNPTIWRAWLVLQKDGLDNGVGVWAWELNMDAWTCRELRKAFFLKLVNEA